MSTDIVVWLAPVALVVVTLGQWIMLRSRYLDGLNKQRARHTQQLQTAGQHIEQAKKQIAQLQRDLSTTKAQLARQLTRAALSQAAATPPAPAPAAAAKPVAEVRPALPVDGFADTLPSLQFPHDASILTTYPAKR